MKYPWWGDYVLRVALGAIALFLVATSMGWSWPPSILIDNPFAGAVMGAMLLIYAIIWPDPNS